MKQIKIIAIALCAVLLLTIISGCGNADAYEEKTPIGTPTISNTGNKLVDSLAEKYYSPATEETELVPGELLVVVSRHYGSINQVHSIEEMATVIKDEYLQKVNGRYELNETAQGLSFSELTQVDPVLLENIIEIEDLSWIDGDIDALGINRETHQQILKLTLKNDSKESTIEIMQLLEKNPILESVEPNILVVWDD